MAQLLRIDCSSRLQGSRSRDLADLVQAHWHKQNPNGTVIIRDLAKTPIPHLNDITISGYFTPKEQHTAEMQSATALSDMLIGELLSADTLLFSVPLYNFSIPSALKAYIDHIVRIEHTFGFDEQRGLYGLLDNKKAYVAAAYGATGYFGGALGSLNFLEPYLKALFNFLGITAIDFFHVEGTSTDPAAFSATRQQALADMELAFARG